MRLPHSWVMWPAMTPQLLTIAAVTKTDFRHVIFHVEIHIPLVFKGIRKKVSVTRAPFPKNFTVARGSLINSSQKLGKIFRHVLFNEKLNKSLLFII